LITICCITYVIVFNSIKMMLLINSLMTQQLGWIIQIGQCHYVWAMADWQWCELELGMIYAWRQSIYNSWGIDCWTCWSHLLINTLHCFGWWFFGPISGIAPLKTQVLWVHFMFFSKFKKKIYLSLFYS
jgi:hypothetical protein